LGVDLDDEAFIFGLSFFFLLPPAKSCFVYYKHY